MKDIKVIQFINPQDIKIIEVASLNDLNKFFTGTDCWLNERKINVLDSTFYLIYNDGISNSSPIKFLDNYYPSPLFIIRTLQDNWEYSGEGVIDVTPEDVQKIRELKHE